MAFPNKKLVNMDRDELLSKCLELLRALGRCRERLQESRRDLPPNKLANDRHQKHKHAWGWKKKRLLSLLAACKPLVGDELNSAIDYELAHDEFLYQKKTHLRNVFGR